MNHRSANRFIAITLALLMIVPIGIVVTLIKADPDSMQIFGRWYVPLMIVAGAVFGIALIVADVVAFERSR